MQQKLNILFLPYWLPSKNNPKNGNFILRHAEAIATLHNITILYVERDDTLIEKFKINIDKNHNLLIIKIYYKGHSYKVINYWKKFRAYTKGLGLIKNIDLIHIHVLYYYAFLALYFKIIKNINFVVTEHWTRWITKDNSLSRKFYCKMMNIVCSQASYILPVSENLADSMKMQGIKGKYKIIPNVVNTQVFKPTINKPEKNIFLHISNLVDDHKNITGILNVSKKLAESGYKFILKIGGDGDNTMIKEFIKNNKLKNYISTFGPLTENEVSYKMRNADMLVMFSNKENQPCVINEAFSCGLPVISTNVGGITEFFPKNFGIIIEKGNENDLYEAMAKCINGKVEFAKPKDMHQYAVNHFSIQIIAKELEKVYSKVLQ